jgi:PAS domain S-box-containing protein
VDDFAHPLQAKGDRLASLQQNVNQLPLQPEKLLEESCEELRTALDELRVAQSALCQPNKELVFKVEERLDIDDCKQALSALGESEERFRSLVSTISGAIYRCACDIVQERTSQLRNAFEQLNREIAERQWMEKELEQSLSLVRATLEATVDGIIVSQNARNITAFNQKFVEMWGLPESAIAPRDLNQLLPSILEQIKDPETFLHHTKDLFCQPDAEGHGIYELKDGRIFERYSLPQWMGDKIVGRVCSFRDITERQRHQTAIRESEERYRAVVEQTSDGIFLVDARTLRILEANAAYCNLLGYTNEELLKLTIYDLVAIDREILEASIQQTLKEKRFFVGEARHRRKDGSEVNVEVNVTLISYDGGKEVFCTVVRDITERKLAEEALKKAKQELEIRVEERTALLRQAVGHLQSEIEERKQAQEQLEQTKHQQKALLDNIPDLAWLKDEKSRFIAVNESFGEVCGVKPENLVGKTDLDIWPLDLAQTYRDDDRKVLLTGQRKCVEEPLADKEGNRTWIETIKTPIFNERGEVIGTTGIARDITDRKQAEEELRRSEARFREVATREALLNRLASQIRNSLNLDTILETAVQELYNHLEIDVCLFGWYVTDSDPAGWEVIKEVTRSAVPSFLGLYPLEAWRPFTCKLIDVQADDKVIDSNACGGALRAQSAREMLLPFGTTAVLSLPIQTQSGELGTITCGRLVSGQAWTDEELEMLQAVANQLVIGINQAQLYEQKHVAATTAQTKAAQLEVAMRELQQAQSQLIQSEKMSSLGQLVAGVAHEINNPLNFIRGNLNPAHEYALDLLELVQLYQKFYPQPSPKIQTQIEAIDLDFIKEDLPKILDSMKIGADRICQIVTSLRSFSRAEQGKMKQFDIHEGLDNTLLILAHRLKAKSNHPAIQVVKEYGNLPLVECYTGQLNQVFMNILTNAIDAIDDYNKQRSPEDIQNNPGIIRICTEVNDFHQVLIRIIDNGLGMTEDVCRRLFDPFFTTKPVGQGTGLGMSISYQIIVKKHGGQLRCISAPDRGAEFLIYLPIQKSS